METIFGVVLIFLAFFAVIIGAVAVVVFVVLLMVENLKKLFSQTKGQVGAESDEPKGLQDSTDSKSKGFVVLAVLALIGLIIWQLVFKWLDSLNQPPPPGW